MDTILIIWFKNSKSVSSNHDKKSDLSFQRSIQNRKKKEQGKSGFIPAIARWVVERSNAWVERCKILVKNYERTLGMRCVKMNLCFVRLMIKRLSASD
jgi:transposase